MQTDQTRALDGEESMALTAFDGPPPPPLDEQERGDRGDGAYLPPPETNLDQDMVGDQGSEGTVPRLKSYSQIIRSPEAQQPLKVTPIIDCVTGNDDSYLAPPETSPDQDVDVDVVQDCEICETPVLHADVSVALCDALAVPCDRNLWV